MKKYKYKCKECGVSKPLGELWRFVAGSDTLEPWEHVCNDCFKKKTGCKGMWEVKK